MDTRIDLTYAYSNLGLLKLLQNDLAGAENQFRRTLKIRSEVGQLEGVLWALEGLAVVTLKQGNKEQAQRLWEEAKVLRKSIFAPVLPHTSKFIFPAFLNPGKTPDQLAGRPHVKSPAVFKQALEPITPPPFKQPAFIGLEEAVSLSKREFEVLNLVAQGHRTNQIADLLVISPGTVNNHINSIYSKLGVNSRTAAIRYAIDHRLF
jgi:DNA-binding CsgD family transcriptional regulator